MVLTLDQLDGGARAEIGAADAHDDQHVGIAADAFGRAADAAQLLGLFKGREIQPAEKIIARPLALRQKLVGIEDLLLRCEHIRQGQVAPDIGYIDFDHVSFLLCESLTLCYCKTGKNSTEEKTFLSRR